MKKLGLAAAAIAFFLAAGQTAHAISISSGDILEVIYNPGGLEYIANIGQSSDLVTAANSGGGVTTVAPLVPGGGAASGITPQSVFGSGNLEGLTIAFVSWDQGSPRTLEMSLGSGALTPPTPVLRSQIVTKLNGWMTNLITDPDGNPVDENYANASDKPRTVDDKFGLQFDSLNGLLSWGIQTTIPSGGLDQLDFYRSASAVSGGDWQNLGYFSFDPSTGVTQFHVPATPTVPEPASLLLLGSGVTGLLVSRRRARSNRARPTH
jgi:hypothetical protein